MKYIAHRGFPFKAPENSIPSFELAAQSKIHFGIECDIHQTKDNQFVVFHDDDLKRMTKNNSQIADLTYEEIQSIYLKSGKNIKKYSDLRIPLLEEFLDICSSSGKTAVIEIKRLNDISQIISLFNLLENYPSLSVIIISFNMSYLKYIRAVSNIQLQLLTSTLSEDIIYDSRVNTLELSIDKKLATKQNIKRLKKEGFKIAVWTIDDQKQVDLLKNIGVDYITTDKL